jgi:hypothetical protein
LHGNVADFNTLDETIVYLLTVAACCISPLLLTPPLISPTLMQITSVLYRWY